MCAEDLHLNPLQRRLFDFVIAGFTKRIKNGPTTSQTEMLYFILISQKFAQMQPMFRAWKCGVGFARR